MAAPCAAFVGGALQLSVMAGIRSDALVAASGSARVVRAMPNTPALVGLGQTGLYARSAVTAAERQWVQDALGSTGACLWLAQEAQLDAVTALSGSGPAYVFYVLEALIDAGVTSFEATSFVSPRAVPQLADAAEVMALLKRKPAPSPGEQLKLGEGVNSAKHRRQHKAPAAVSASATSLLSMSRSSI